MPDFILIRYETLNALVNPSVRSASPVFKTFLISPASSFRDMAGIGKMSSVQT